MNTQRCTWMSLPGATRMWSADGIVASLPEGVEESTD
jgi:hypothetical protein